MSKIMGQHCITQQKVEIRKNLKQIRAAIPTLTRKAHAESIMHRLLEMSEVASALTLFIYISYASEVDTHDLIKQFIIQGKTLAVPKIINNDHMIATPFIRWDDLMPDALGILTPQGTKPYPGEIDITITPGLGFTPAGHRMGFGRGYYDKWFVNNKAGMKIALAYEAQINEELPIDINDIPVDMIVTEQRVIQI